MTNEAPTTARAKMSVVQRRHPPMSVELRAKLAAATAASRNLPSLSPSVSRPGAQPRSPTNNNWAPAATAARPIG